MLFIFIALSKTRMAMLFLFISGMLEAEIEFSDDALSTYSEVCVFTCKIILLLAQKHYVDLR